MSFITDFLYASLTWKTLTPAQRRALQFPWKEPHPRVKARLTELGLWDEQGVTRSGAVIALCRFQSSPSRTP